jgi:N-methylhydantoinase A/oxoprolinase/acetone carboxylase beta subunit
LSLRIGIDVGGTNTDSVLLDRSNRLLARAKSPTTADVSTGIRQSLRALLANAQVDPRRVGYCMLGTTHCINAILERKGLDRVAVIRIGAPASKAIPPFADWPNDLTRVIRYRTFFVEGGNEFDGRAIGNLAERRLRTIGSQIDGRVRSIAITSIFSPVTPDHEILAGRLLRATMRHHASVSLSHQIATIGLLERENATILNAALQSVARRAVGAFRRVTRQLGLRAHLYLGQNDGTLMNVESALRQPIRTVASGPTNSIRGASFLAGISDSIVVDVGGTSTDIGLLKAGFPLESSRPGSVGGVRTNFRIPDVLSIALGGGSRVRRRPRVTVGPDSVGYRLSKEARSVGGPTLTATDIAVALGRCEFGDPRRLRDLSPAILSEADRVFHSMVEAGIERVRTSAKPLPVVLVGGGSVLLKGRLKGTSRVVRPKHFDVANAIGVAIAEVGADVDTVLRYGPGSRAEALAHTCDLAVDRAVNSGADRRRTRVANIEEIPLTYLPGNAVRVRVKACGALSE